MSLSSHTGGPLSKASIIANIANELMEERVAKAKDTLSSHYPFVPIKKHNRSYSELQKSKLFLRDGFVDRYTGERLVFPAALRLISYLLPEEFPYHPNWKMTVTHIAYWELSPTVDHVLPVSRGGEDAEYNWVTTSMLRNSIKAQWTLEELRWELHPPGDVSEWDGLMGWFLQYVDNNPDLLSNNFFGVWQKAAISASKCL